MNCLIYQCCFPLQHHPTSITWTCALKNKQARCYATVHQTGDTFTAGNRDHCHQSNPGTLVRHQVAAAVKAGARENVHASSMAIVERELLTLPENAANLPDPNLLKRRANRTGQAMRPKYPHDLDFELDPDHLPPVFCRRSWWHIQSRTGTVCTTAIDPCICATRRERQAGTAAILLDVALYKKDYKAVFRTVQALINEEGYGDPVIQQVVTDFEKAIWQGIRATFRAVEVRGCAFHWAQAVWWKMQDLGLATAYREYQDVGQFLRKVLGLPFLPREHILATFDHLSTLARNSECYQIVQLLDYVDETWLQSETLAAGVYTGDRCAPTTTWRAGITASTSGPAGSQTSTSSSGICTTRPSWCPCRYACCLMAMSSASSASRPVRRRPGCTASGTNTIVVVRAPCPYSLQSAMYIVHPISLGVCTGTGTNCQVCISVSVITQPGMGKYDSYVLISWDVLLGTFSSMYSSPVMCGCHLGSPAIYVLFCQCVVRILRVVLMSLGKYSWRCPYLVRDFGDALMFLCVLCMFCE